MVVKIKHILVLSLIFFASCTKDWLDVNDDPNSSTEVNSKLLFNAAMLDFSNNLVDAGVSMMYWSQHWAASSDNDPTFSDKELYKDVGFTTDNTWRTYYAYCIKNLVFAGKIALEDENDNAYAICNLMSALFFYHLTIMWEDVPFSQAIDYENHTYPVADKQENILLGIINMIDESINMINTDPEMPWMKTLIYYDDNAQYEDMEKWIRMGNSLKLRILMILATKDPATYSTLVGEHINSGKPMISSNEENCLFPYFDATGNKNPFYRLWETYTEGVPYFFFPSKVLVDMMNTLQDPRREVWFLLPTNTNSYSGVVPGGPLGQSSFISNKVIRPDTETQIITYSETALFIAEAYARGWTGSVDLTIAKEYYEKGIKANMQFYGIPNQSITEYLKSLQDLTKIQNPEIAVKEINKQQYIDCFMKPHEGWVQVRRTNVPELEIPEGAVRPGLIKRWHPPSAEVVTNVNLSFPKPLEEKMWFDK